MPDLKSTPSADSPDHQSQAALPGLIQEVSAIAEGGLRLSTMCDSISRPGALAIISTRHGDGAGVATATERLGSSIWGERRASRALASRPECVRYMPE